MAEANIAWKAEIQASGLGELFKSRGALYVYESEAAFAAGAEERALQKAKGTEFEIVDGNRARELAPGLSERIVRGVYYPHGMHTINPYKVVTTLAERFAADGGTILRGRVRGFGRDGANGVNRVTSVEITDREPAGQGGGDRGRPRLGRADAPARLQRAAGRRARLSRDAGARQCALRPAGEPGRARLLHHADGGRPARRRHRRAGRAAPAAVLASRRSAGPAPQGRSSPASAAPSRAAGSASGRPCPTSGRRSAARRGLPTSIAATATSMSA